jgi:hypothetical protein
MVSAEEHDDRQAAIIRISCSGEKAMLAFCALSASSE